MRLRFQNFDEKQDDAVSIAEVEGKGEALKLLRMRTVQ
jgi:hypothetical protein